MNNLAAWLVRHGMSYRKAADACGESFATVWRVGAGLSSLDKAEAVSKWTREHDPADWLSIGQVSSREPCSSDSAVAQ